MIDSSAGTFYSLSSTGNIQYRIAKTDWSAFNETNDYSYRPAAPFGANNHITVYYKGALVYGTEPTIVSSNVQQLQMAETEIVSNKGTTIYPNPVVSSFKVQVSKVEVNATIQLINAYGAVVGSFRLTNTAQEISMKGMAAGIYFIKVKNGQQLFTQKIIKQ